MNELRDEIYLGDGVYAGHDGFHIWIWSSNGISSSKLVALEPAVLDQLIKYRAFLKDRAARRES